MPKNKANHISRLLGQPFKDILQDLYQSRLLSGVQIADKLHRLTGIQLTTRSVQRSLKQFGLIRSYSEAFKLAIKSGRKSYDPLRKPIKSSSLRRGINPKLRYQILKRDNFSCVLCGKTAKDDLLQIDHIIPVVKGGKNEIDNLRTLCRECNNGKMLLEEKYV
jgi:hypothetical protein